MNRSDVIEAVERVKASEARTLSGQMAPEIETLEAAVSYQLITWAEIAEILGVAKSTVHRARATAIKVRESWKEKGILPDSGGMGKSHSAKVVTENAHDKVTEIEDGKAKEGTVKPSLIEALKQRNKDES